MALSLSLLVDERNDNKMVTFVDNSTGWGTDSDPDYTDLVSLTGIQNNQYGLVMRITMNTPTGITVFDDIDLVSQYGPFATQDDLSFAVDATILEINNAAYGTTDSLLPDGIWDVKYVLVKSVSGTITDITTKLDSILIIGQATKAVYNKLRLVPIYYDSKICKERDVKEAMFYNTFLTSIRKNAYIARKDELLQMLDTLNRLLLNGSNYPW